MSFQAQNIALASTEIFLLVAICVVLLADLFIPAERKIVTYWLALASIAGSFAFAWSLGLGGPVLAFNGSFVLDGMATVLKLATCVIVALAFVYSRAYMQVRDLFEGEFYVLGLFGMLGMFVMISAHSFLTIYLGLELLSLSLYAMVAFDRKSSVASEAAMKYFVLGAIASGTLLYGISVLYGLTGTLDLGELAHRVGAEQSTSLPILFALSFVLVGVAFKLGAVPFHMWIPDVYHGAPTTVTLYLGSAPKIAAFALIMRVLVEGLGDLYGSWRDMLIIMAVLSMGIGNVVAIAQTNIKRMLAYSTISHVGFILLGFIGGGATGNQAAMFYTLTYALMAAGAFGVVILLSRSGMEADRLEDFKGLNARSPWFAGIMVILMFSMAGVPPLVGFYAKWVVLAAVVDAGLAWLAVTGVVFSVIGAFYYLRVVKLMYFDEPDDDSALRADLDLRLLLSANGLAVLALGVFPGALIGLCAAVLS